MDRTDWAEHYKDLWIKAKARADAAEALAKEEGEARDHWFDLATYEVGGVPQHWKDRAEKAEATIADLTAKLQAAEAEHRFSLGLVDNAQATIASLTAERDALIRKRDEARAVAYETYDGEIFATIDAVMEYCRGKPYGLGEMGWTEKKVRALPATEEKERGK
jgi:hypothetical protein